MATVQVIYTVHSTPQQAGPCTVHCTLYSIGKIYAVYVPLHAGPLYSTVHVKSAGIHYTVQVTLFYSVE